jgi:hypothetical protein
MDAMMRQVVQKLAAAAAAAAEAAAAVDWIPGLLLASSLAAT